jgi:hypothetical protein
VITAPAIRAALALYDGWTYAPAAGDVRRCFYPLQSRKLAMYLPQAGPLHTDCTCYVEGVVLAAAADTRTQWGRMRHRRAMISTPEQAKALTWLRTHTVPRHAEGDAEHRAACQQLHGLPDELIAAGLAEAEAANDYSPDVGDWWVGQLWERDWSSGHTVLIEGRDESVIVHEASRSAGRVITREVSAWPLPGWYWQRWARLLVG